MNSGPEVSNQSVKLCHTIYPGDLLDLGSARSSDNLISRYNINYLAAILYWVFYDRAAHVGYNTVGDLLVEHTVHSIVCVHLFCAQCIV